VSAATREQILKFNYGENSVKSWLAWKKEITATTSSPHIDGQHPN